MSTIVVVLLLLICSASVSSEGSYEQVLDTMFKTYEKDTSTIKKTVFSKSRTVFFAGIEGSGHHAFRMIFKPCVCQGEDCVSDVCERERDMAGHLMVLDENTKKVKGLFGSNDLEHFEGHLRCVNDLQGLGYCSVRLICVLVLLLSGSCTRPRPFWITHLFSIAYRVRIILIKPILSQHPQRRGRSHEGDRLERGDGNRRLPIRGGSQPQHGLRHDVLPQFRRAPEGPAPPRRDNVGCSRYVI